MNTTENNKLIAEFMGMTQGKPNESRWKNDWFEKLTVGGNDFESGRRHKYLHFNSDYNWLMEVVGRIEALENSNSVVIAATICYINAHDKHKNELVNFKTVEQTKIEAVYNAVIQFIVWYNSAEKGK